MGLALHPQVQRADRAHEQPDLEVPGRGADRHPVLAQLRRQALVGDADGAAEHVRVTREVLGGRVHHSVYAEQQRALQRRRCEGAIHDNLDAQRRGRRGVRGDVHDLAGRIDRRLQPDHVPRPQTY